MGEAERSIPVTESGQADPAERSTGRETEDTGAEAADKRRKKEISALAAQVLSVAHDEILIRLRFFDAALARISLKEQPGLSGMACDGSVCYYDPVWVLSRYRRDVSVVARSYLHLLLHCIFSHGFRVGRLDPELWNLAADIAVENVILELRQSGLSLDTDGEALAKLSVLREDIGALTADRIYRYFRQNPMSDRERQDCVRLFYRDAHDLWGREETAISQEEWKKLSERIKADLKTFTKEKSGRESLVKNLEETTRDRYDYREILRNFTVFGEELAVSEDEFDYVYYTYGLEHYGNLPLIEPLEYREAEKVREFVIAIDTSASCRGPLVRAFLKKTYSILKSSESFFHKINVHIVQCDSEVRSDTRVTCEEDLERFLQTGKLAGFGATDFRPVFDYVDELKRRGEFEDLKGLIYFTDGYGVYPERMPDYEVIFAFLEEDEYRAPAPSWSLKVILESEDLEREELEDEA